MKWAARQRRPKGDLTVTGESITRYDYEIHPLAALFPELPAKEFEELKADIQKNGQLEPIIISSQRPRTVLDGRNRLRACKELGITPYTRFFAEVRHSEMTEEEFILSKNLFRRHLTPDQRAMLAAQCADEIEKAARERQSSGLRKGDHSSVGSNSTQRERTRDSVSKTANVSQHKARQALAVRKDPELTKDVASGKKSLKQASKEVSDFVRAPQSKQKTATATAVNAVMNFNMDMLLAKIIADLGKRLRAVPANRLAEFKEEVKEAFDAWLMNL